MTTYTGELQLKITVSRSNSSSGSSSR